MKGIIHCIWLSLADVSPHCRLHLPCREMYRRVVKRVNCISAKKKAEFKCRDRSYETVIVSVRWFAQIFRYRVTDKSQGSGTVRCGRSTQSGDLCKYLWLAIRGSQGVSRISIALETQSNWIKTVNTKNAMVLLITISIRSRILLAMRNTRCSSQLFPYII